MFVDGAKCGGCGVLLSKRKRIWIGIVKGVKESCHSCHVARVPTTDYLLDNLAIAQWELWLAEIELADGEDNQYSLPRATIEKIFGTKGIPVKNAAEALQLYLQHRAEFEEEEA